MEAVTGGTQMDFGLCPDPKEGLNSNKEVSWTKDLLSSNKNFNKPKAATLI